uniref:Kinesin-associated protein 3 n=1 Tax=Cacopsylla melanoneura TaxID=428564 RepID=A0A8D8M8X6_9HEMI
MQSEEAKYIKKRVKSGTIDVHPTEKALIVNYELEALILEENGKPMIGDKKECQKTIRLKSLGPDTNCQLLAKEVVAKCNLIHPSKLAEVEHLIYYLQSRKSNAFSKVSPEENVTPSAGDLMLGSGLTNGEKASFTNIEEYVELLYDDMSDKIKGSTLILQLAKDPNNLEELSRSETVLSALSRVLREDWKKNVDLSSNIIHVFYCFSVYHQFHPIILQYKIGSICIEIIDHELRRYFDWKNKLDNLSKMPPPPSRLPVRRSASITRQSPKSQIPVGISYSSTGNRRHSEALSTSMSAPPRRPLSVMTSSLVEGEDERIVQSRLKFQVLTSKQDQLLRVGFNLLMNIGENTKVEDKVRKRNIVEYLVTCVDRQNKEQLNVVLLFLRKLSIYHVNKEQMANLNLIEKLPRILMIEDSNLQSSTLRLLFNLSFDTKLREKIIKIGFLPKLVSLLEEGKHQKIILQLLYHLSIEDRVKAMFAYTNCMTLLMNMLLIDQDEVSDKEKDNVLVALCVNLALNSRNSELMLKNRQLQFLMDLALTQKNVLLLKVIRNMSLHSNIRHYFGDYIDSIADYVQKERDEVIKLECLGILGNLVMPDLDYFKLLKDHNLDHLILKWLQNRSIQDDFILEVINFIGTAATDPICAEHFCKNTTVDQLINLLKEMQEDDEIVLQILYVFYQICRHTNCQSYLIKETDAPAYMIDLLNDDNPRIRKVCDLTLNIIRDCDKSWAEKIQVQKFTHHNQQWLEMVESKTSVPGSVSRTSPHEADPLKNLLRNSLLFPSDPFLNSGDEIEIISNNPLSDDNLSRPMSRLDVEEDNDEIDLELMKMKYSRDTNSNETEGRNALRNLVITDEQSGENFIHIDNFNGMKANNNGES